MGKVDEQEVMGIMMPTMMMLVEIVIMNLFQVVDFIKKHGLKGPEGTYPKEGQYTQVLYCLVWVALAYPKKGKQTQHSGMHAYCMRLYRML